MQSIKIFIFLMGCLFLLPICAAENKYQSLGLLINAGNNNYLFYSKGEVKELLLNRKGKPLMVKKHACASVSYFGNDREIKRINNIVFNQDDKCYQNEEISKLYVSEYAYGGAPKGFKEMGGNKVYLAYNYTPDEENRFFFYLNGRVKYYVFGNYDNLYVKSEMCNVNKKLIKCKRYNQSGPAIGRLNEEINYVDVYGSYQEEGEHILYDPDGSVTLIEIKNKDDKKYKIIFDRYPERRKRFTFS
ncbi:TPA: hypothetical protein N3F15_002945 [Klebsiella aerogenes]|nr:hypothetical protein [Klebsiella aerogenes]